MLTTDLDINGCVILILRFNLVLLGHRRLLFIVRHFFSLSLLDSSLATEARELGCEKITEEVAEAYLKRLKLCSFTKGCFGEVDGGSRWRFKQDSPVIIRLRNFRPFSNARPHHWGNQVITANRNRMVREYRLTGV
jgi:hypothetical protein